MCVNAGDRLWITSGHNHGGYASTSYGGYASLSYGYEPPSNGYGYASTSYGGLLLSAMDMPLLKTDMDRPLPECPMVDMPLHEQDMNTATWDRSLLLQGGKLLEAQT